VYLLSVAQKFGYGDVGSWGFGDLSATEVLTVPHCIVSSEQGGGRATDGLSR
jgi:hypothetical protein